ncbi:MAG: FadR/GntR family transcriptional regulator [Rhodospirillaceae bacterium]
MTPTDHLFERIRHESLAEMVVDKIEDMIVRGVLREGNRLPSERELAERLDVSRPKLREALKTLEERGLVETRHGEGSFIAPLSGQAMTPALIDLFARHGLAFYDYLEYRREQEAIAARLASERATQTDKVVIETQLAALERAHAQGDEDMSREADLQLHIAIVNASHNAMLIHMMTSIYDLTRRGVFYNRDFLRCVDETGNRLLEQHRKIANTVLAGDAEAAEAAARAHLDFVEVSFRIGEEQARREKYAAMRQLVAE